jgi:hypothetical protein
MRSSLRLKPLPRWINHAFIPPRQKSDGQNVRDLIRSTNLFEVTAKKVNSFRTSPDSPTILLAWISSLGLRATFVYLIVVSCLQSFRV